MKQFYLLLSMLLLSTGLAAQTYVNAAAADGGDGTSWASAYNSLDDALAAASSGDEIWVAAGTYVPAGDRFEVNADVIIVGGFNGTETSADAADPSANPTILSGDVDGNDDAGDFTVNRDDNKRIMLVAADILGTTVIEGFTFTGGQTAIDTSADLSGTLADFSGASLQAFSPVEVDNCSFLNSNSDLGNVMILDPGTAGSHITNSSFNGNFGNRRAAAIYVNFTTDVVISDCEFNDNRGLRGAVYLVNVDGLALNNSTFNNNQVSGFACRGAALGVLFYDNVTVTNCEFNNNIVATADQFARGGTVYLAHDAEVDPDPSRIVFEGCDFEGGVNQGDLGGTIYTISADYTFNNCSFEGGFGSRGGTAFNFVTDAMPRQAVFSDCLFEGNNSTEVGHTLSAQGHSSFNISNSTFSGNGNDGAGWAAFGPVGDFDTTAAGPTVYNFDNVDFIGNSSGNVGGAIFMQSPTGTAEMHFTNSSFQGNIAPGANGGGAIYSSNSVLITMDNVVANANSASAGTGGFMTKFSEAPDAGAGTRNLGLEIKNSVFYQQTASGQGAVFNLVNGGDFSSENSLYFDNTVTESGSGGVLIANGDSIGQEVILINNTFVGNSAGSVDGPFFGDDVAIFTADGVADVTELNLQNNAFASTGTSVGNVSIEPDVMGGNGTVTSVGGNFFIQEPADFTPADTDIVDDGADPEDGLFVNYESFGDIEDIDLTPIDVAGNPLIDNAIVNEDTPATDLNGADRGDNPDIGAIEAEGVTLPTIFEIVANSEVHTALEGFLNTAGLAATLSGEGPYTLFAPTDDAFAMLDAATVANVEAMLNQTLLTHVANGTFLSGGLSDGQVIPSLFTGADLNIAIPGSVEVSTEGSEVATVISANLEASNGVVHVIDRVLVSNLVAVQNIDESGLDVTFFPNPVQNFMNVAVKDITAENIEVSVLNLNGQRVSNWVLGNGNNIIDFTRVPAGTYTLEISIDGQMFSKQVVKQ